MFGGLPAGSSLGDCVSSAAENEFALQEDQVVQCLAED